jgi:hypothetical protein
MRLLVAVTGTIAMLGASAAFAATGGVSWGKAVEVPGAETLNTGGQSAVSSVSCPRARACTAGGYYFDGTWSQPFVLDETDGAWGTASQVPGTAALSGGGGGQVNSVSCSSAGNCAAGGSYYQTTSHAFVANETNGVWGDAVEVPGVAALSTSGSAGLNTISCSRNGDCAAAGYFHDDAGQQSFVVNETQGVWGMAIEAPGTAALNTGGNDYIRAISCASRGNCAAGGEYSDGDGNVHALVVSEAGGVWRKAIELPGTAAFEAAYVESVSCGSEGRCVAVGYFQDAKGNLDAFVADEKHGVWRAAITVPGLGTLDAGGGALASSVSCASAGNCSAGGFYTDGSHVQRAFVVSEKKGVWLKARVVPGPAGSALAYVSSVSCAGAGRCAAVVLYADHGGHWHLRVSGQRKGKWHTATDVAGPPGFDVAGGLVGSDVVSCARSGRCAIGGGYVDANGKNQPFVTSH